MMIGSCLCHLGLSARAIAGSGRDHPHDPADLQRCVQYWGTGKTAELQRRMGGRSPEWDRLLHHWDDLVASLRHEIDTRTDGRAPRTYFEMQRAINGGTDCTDCATTGIKDVCTKCKGTGRRSGGRCRPCYGSGITAYCPTCRGAGYTKPARRTANDDHR